MKNIATVLILAAFWAAPARAQEARIPGLVLLPSPAVPLETARPAARPAFLGVFPAPTVRGARPRAVLEPAPAVLPELRSRFEAVPMPSFEPQEVFPPAGPAARASGAVSAARKALGMEEKSSPPPSALRSVFDGPRR